MTKGQTEFLVSMCAIIVSLFSTGVIICDINHADSRPEHIIAYVPPLIVGTVVPTAVPTAVPTHGPIISQPTIISVPTENCDVLRSIHIAMTKAQVVKICGNPERIDDSSAEVLRVEKVFKHDEIWYYDKQSETVELTNDIVTAIHPTILQALPVIRQ